MKIKSRKPHRELRDLINRYLLLRVSYHEMKEVELLPTGFSYLTLGMGKPGFFCSGKIEKRLPRVFIGGQIAESGLHLRPDEKLEHLGIEFRPAGLHALYQVDMSETTDRFVDFIKVTDEKETNMLHSIVKDYRGFKKTCRKLDAYFLNMATGKATEPFTANALGIILKNNGFISMEDLAIETGLSTRQLRRRFNEVIGISPQKYSKIIQLKYVLELIEKDERSSLTEIAYQSNFYDVAHFTKTFKRMMNSHPRDFLSSEDALLQTYLSV